jgi:hypothetical protein
VSGDTIASVFRETFTKPLPAGTEIFTRKGEPFARGKDGRDGPRTAPLTTGAAALLKSCGKG